MNIEDIEKRIYSFPSWHYQFDLNGVTTPIFDETLINRHIQRRRYFFDPLVELCGGSLKGKRVLDLGCNAGYWSLLSLKHGCEFVLGIDGRKMLIDQANFVFEVNQVQEAKYRFLEANIFDIDWTTLGSFDIVLCLGLMYHVNKPVDLIERISLVNSDILVIDTAISLSKSLVFEIGFEDLADPRNALNSELITRPSIQALQDVVRYYGYDIIVLKPDFSDYTGSKDYGKGVRKAFLCTKVSRLSDLARWKGKLPGRIGNTWDPERGFWVPHLMRTLRLYLIQLINRFRDIP